MAERLILLYNNKADAGTYAGGSWTNPLTYIQDPRPTKKARSSGLTLANTLFTLDCGEAVAVKVFAVTHTNLSSAAQYKITWFSDAFVTAVSNTGWCSIPGYPDSDPDDIGVGIFHVLADAITYRYFKFEFDDNSSVNTDDYIEIGRVFVSPYWQPTYNFGEDNSDGVEPNTPMQKSLGGTKYFVRRRPERTFSFGFERLLNSDSPDLRAIRKISNINKQVVILPEPSDTSYLNDTCFVGTLRTMPAFKRLQAGDYTTAYEVIESV